MSLNRLSMEDLDPNAVIDSDLVTPPNTQAPASKKLTIIAADKNHPAGAVPVDLIEQVTTANTVIAAAQAGQTKVLELKDLQKNIISQEMVCRGDVMSLQSSFENIVTQRVPAASFTPHLSKTNYQAVCRAMSARISKEEAAMASSVQLLVGEPLSVARNLYAQFKDSYLPVLKSQVTDLQSQAIVLADKLKDLRDTMFVNKGEFFDFKSVSLIDIELDTIETKVSEDFVNALTSLKDLMQCSHLLGFVMAVKDGKSYMDALSHEVRAQYSSSSLGIQDLVAFYARADLLDMMDEAMQMCEQTLESLDVIEKEGLDQADPSMIESFMVRHSGFVAQAFGCLGHMVKVQNGLAHLNLLTNVIFRHFKSL